MIAGTAQMYRSQPLSLLAYSMRVQLKLGAQAEDDKHKEYCDAEFEKSADEEKATNDKMASEDATISELTDGIATLTSDVATLTETIKELDKSVALATDGRKAEHAEYSESATLNDAANQLLEKAKQRLYKFYNPNLYVAPAKKELSMEDSLYVKAGREEFASPALVQIRAHSRVSLPEAPEIFSGIQRPKREKSTGVVALMEMMQKDMQADMKDNL